MAEEHGRWKCVVVSDLQRIAQDATTYTTIIMSMHKHRPYFTAAPHRSRPVLSSPLPANPITHSLPPPFDATPSIDVRLNLVLEPKSFSLRRHNHSLQLQQKGEAQSVNKKETKEPELHRPQEPTTVARKRRLTVLTVPDS